MCGIVGAAARRDIVPVLIEGLRRLEYRGYDSCGVALVNGAGIDRIRSVERVADLARQISRNKIVSETGIAHTRWATHGAPLTKNAHPMLSNDEIAVVHNGIIENYEELRTELKAKGYVFDSQTDTEVIAHLVHCHYQGDLFQAVRRAVKRLAGAYAIAVVAKSQPGRVVGARAGNPLVVGVGAKENFLASDAMALAGTTDRIAYLEDGDVAEIGLDGYRIFDAADRQAKRELRTVKAEGGAVELGPYRHYMQKEIFEQPAAVADTLEGIESITPALFGAALALEPQLIAWAERFAKKEHALFLGRGLHYPIALEGALKLKEISYIHAEAYPAGELKHGPLALVTAEMPVVTVAPNDALLDKVKSNMQEVRARGGELYVLTDADTKISPSEGVHVIRLPEHYGVLSPILHVVPLQLLAYHTALARNTDVDKPRNLAKSVTVE
jgi:glucosamine--fructose-6-phosphate aminotransferase (isomerizing)